MDKNQFNNFFRSRLFLGIVLGIILMLVVTCIFEAGVAVGFHEATFSSHWGANYGKNFGDENSPSNTLFPGSNGPTPDGLMGKVISITSATGSSTDSTTTLIISSPNKPEEKVLDDTDTTIRDHENTVTLSDIKVGSYVVVLGTPDAQGEIDANLIRLVPSPL
jgi:hypothetical protein